MFVGVQDIPLHRRENRYNADYAKEVQSSRPSYSVKTFSGKFRRIHRKALVMDSRGFFWFFWKGGSSFFNNGAGRRAT